MAGRYAPGEKLPRQRELAADLGVTLQPLREALKRLEQIGVVEARHGDATRVRDWRAHGTLDVLAHLGPAVLGDLLEARSLMLREMAGLAAERRDTPRARAIAALAERFAGCRRWVGGPPICAPRPSSTSPSSPRSPRPRATSSSC